jgi:hypothetical protein
LVSITSSFYRALYRGRIGIFYAFKMPKRIGDDVGDLKYVFTKTKQKCLKNKMCLITLKVFKIC